MLTNEQLDEMQGDAGIYGKIGAICAYRLIAQARRTNELLAEVERLRRDHEAMNVLRRLPWGKGMFRAFMPTGIPLDDPADALMEWAEKYGTQETAK